MIQHVLSVACTEFKTSDKLDKLVVKTVNVSLDDSAFTLLLDLVLYLTASLLDHFLDTCRVDTSVGNKLFEGDPCDLTSDLVEAGNSNSLGSIVDDKIDACKSFESSDVSSLTTDDTSLHFVIGERNN